MRLINEASTDSKAKQLFDAITIPGSSSFKTAILNIISDDDTRFEIEKIMYSNKNLENKTSDILKVIRSSNSFIDASRSYHATNIQSIANSLYNSIKNVLPILTDENLSKLKDRVEYFYADFLDKYEMDHMSIICSTFQNNGDDDFIQADKGNYLGFVVTFFTDSGKNSVYYNFDRYDDDEYRDKAINSLVALDRIKDRMERMYPNLYTKVIIRSWSRIQINILIKDEK